jgi:hypothetical protein
MLSNSRSPGRRSQTRGLVMRTAFSSSQRRASRLRCRTSGGASSLYCSRHPAVSGCCRLLSPRFRSLGVLHVPPDLLLVIVFGLEIRRMALSLSFIELKPASPGGQRSKRASTCSSACQSAQALVDLVESPVHRFCNDALALIIRFGWATASVCWTLIIASSKCDAGR